MAKLRSDLDALRKKKSAGAPVGGAPAKLPLMLAGLALLVSIIALFR